MFDVVGYSLKKRVIMDKYYVYKNTLIYKTAKYVFKLCFAHLNCHIAVILTNESSKTKSPFNTRSQDPHA